MKLERDLMKQIKNGLVTYKLCKQVIWFTRLQGGKAKVGSYYINLSEPGTPDWVVIILGKNKELGVLFIEAKSDTGKIRQSQKEWHDKHIGHPLLWIITMVNISQLDDFMNNNSYDFTNDILIKI